MFETEARDGMVVNEDLILEIVRPGIGDPVTAGDVGEIVVTSLDPQHPWIRLALGDLTAALPGTSPCGRTNMRIKDWMGCADQTVTRAGEADVMTLKAECTSPNDALQDQLAASLRAVTKLGGNVELVPIGALPNDGRIIADER